MASRAKTWAEGRGKKTERQKTEERVRESVASHKPIRIVESSVAPAIASHEGRHRANDERIREAGTRTSFFKPVTVGTAAEDGRHLLDLPPTFSPSGGAAEALRQTGQSHGYRRTFSDQEVKKLDPMIRRERARALHDRAAKDQESTAKQHVEVAAALSQMHSRDVAAARSETAHESGSQEDHFEAHKAHALAASFSKEAAQHAEQRAAYHASEHEDGGGKVGTRTDETHGQAAERWKQEAARLRAQEKDHADRAEDHARLASSHGDMSKITMVSAEPLEGADAKNGHEVIKQVEEHVAAAVDHKLKAREHREESKKVEARVGSDWDEGKHPRDEQGRFA